MMIFESMPHKQKQDYEDQQNEHHYCRYNRVQYYCYDYS